MKILSNLPIEDLTIENDYLGIIEKGDMITSLLKSGAVDLSVIKMFALYGNWGSGKSTLMKYMKKQFDASENRFKTFYFDAWEYENGRDLSYSLLEFMIDEGFGDGEKAARNILKIGADVLTSAAKGISFSIPGVNISGKDIIESLENEDDVSFHTKIQVFKKRFEDVENINLSSDSEKYNIVFIDDLDRCEPEKVLDLLSEIKLFFTYGKRTIFFFGVDEKAVQIAIKTKYREVVKSNEYLEKVFDLTFHLREDLDVKKFIYTFFPKRTINNIGSGVSYQKYILEFFNLLKLTNPRKLKKILNAYFIYSNYIISQNLNGSHQLIFDEENEGSFLITVTTLYLISCRLFHPEQFAFFGEKQDLRNVLVQSVDDNLELKNKIKTIETARSYANQSSNNRSIYHFLSKKQERLNNHRGKILVETINDYDFGKFAIIFAPNNIGSFDPTSLYGLTEFLDSFESNKNNIGFNMMWYLYSRIHKSYDILKDNESEISPLEIKAFIKKIL